MPTDADLGTAGLQEVAVREPHAGSEARTMPLDRFLASCQRDFDDGGVVVDRHFSQGSATA